MHCIGLVSVNKTLPLTREYLHYMQYDQKNMRSPCIIWKSYKQSVLTKQWNCNARCKGHSIWFAAPKPEFKVIWPSVYAQTQKQPAATCRGGGGQGLALLLPHSGGKKLSSFHPRDAPDLWHARYFRLLAYFQFSSRYTLLFTKVGHPCFSHHSRRPSSTNCQKLQWTHRRRGWQHTQP